MRHNRHLYPFRNVLFKALAFCLVVFLFLSQSSIPAGQGAMLAAGLPWQNLPFYGGQVTAVLVDPGSAQTIYAGTQNAGVFKSIDAGVTWLPARSGMSSAPVRCLLASPTQAGTLYAGTEQNGVWKTTDGGATWSFAGSGIDKKLNVFNLVMDPASPNTLYAGAGGSNGHIYKSTNGGASWQIKESGIPLETSSTYIDDVYALAMDPAQPEKLYAGTASRGVFATTNGGDSWTAMSTGLPYSSTPYYSAVNALAVIPGATNQVAAIYSGKYYVYQASTWQVVNASGSSANSSVSTAHLYFYPNNPSIIYSAGAEFKVSTDGGMNWTQRLGWDKSSNILAIAFHPTTPDTIYAASDYLFEFGGGVWKTVDQGLNWTHPTQDPIAHRISAVAADPVNPQKIFAGAGDGGDGQLFYSLDGGQNWSNSKVTDYAKSQNLFQEVNDIAIDPKNPQKVYATALFHFFVSSDGGENFTSSDAIAFPSSVTVPAGGPANVVYVSSSFPGKGIIKSTDGGSTWNPVNTGIPLNYSSSICPISKLVEDPANADTVWAATNDRCGVIRTINGGQAWTVQGLTGHDQITALAMHPTKSSTLLAGTSDSSTGAALFITTDAGASWNKVRSVPALVNDIVYDPQNPDWVYLFTDGAGVLQSADGGQHWGDYSTGIFHLSLSAGAFTSGEAPRLLAGSLGSGLYWVQPDLEVPPLRYLYLPAVTK